MKRTAVLLLLLTLVGCKETNNYRSPTDPAKEDLLAFAAFDWNYLSQNQVVCLGQGCGIQFLDRSTNARRWNWNFGDGGNSNLRDPIHFYRADTCGRSSPCEFLVNLQVCPGPDMRFDDELCSAAQNVVIVPPPS